MKRSKNYSEIVCDACEEVFAVRPGTIRLRRDGELHFRYLLCPHCGAAFLIDITDLRLRRHMRTSGILGRQVGQAMQNELRKKYTQRFVELVPNAYFKEGNGRETKT